MFEPLKVDSVAIVTCLYNLSNPIASSADSKSVQNASISYVKCCYTDYMLLLEFCWIFANSKSVQMPPYHRLNVVIQTTCSYWNFAELLPTLSLCKCLHIIG